MRVEMEIKMKHKKVLKNMLMLILIGTLCVTGFSKDKDKPLESQWAAAPASIDGMNTEWGKVPMNTYKKTDVDYAFMNDGENLFILYTFKNPKFLSSISWTGLTVWFSPEGKKEKDLGIRFIRKQISADDYIAILEKQVGQAMPEDRKNQIRQNKSYWLFDQELVNKKAADYSEDAERPKYNGASFRSNVLDKAVLFEIVINFAKLAEIAPEIGIEPGKGLSLNFDWGGATKEYKEALASGLASRDMRARDEGASGSLTEERRAGESLGSLERDSSDLARMRGQLQRVKQYDFWVAVKLAQNQ
jgi:hypothetical protein